MSPVHAVIIAGGRGERLGGVRKGDLRIGGRRLLDRVTEALGPVQSPLMIAAGPDGQAGAIPRGAVAIRDLDAPVGGPLAGLAAAVAALQARGIGAGLLVSVAVDSPLLPQNYVARLHDGLGTAPAAYAAWEGQFYPPNAIWRLEALTELPERVRQNGAAHSLRALQLALGAVEVVWTGAPQGNPFANLNTMADLIALGRRVENEAPARLIHTSGN